MAKYKSLKGQPIQVLTADPPAPVEGQVWVVAAPGTASVMKGYRLGAGTWASGGNVNIARSLLSGFGASNSSSIITGGSASPPNGGADTDHVESYNGTAWSEIAEINTAGNNHGSFGTATAGLICGGLRPGNVALTEIWNGASWTEVADLNTARNGFITSCNGTTTAGLAGPGASNTNLVESWNGASWTEIAETNSSLYLRGGTGNAPATSTMLFGGGYPRSANTEIWNGSSWTEVNNLNNTRADLGGGGDSISSAIGFGGRSATGPTIFTEAWDGTSWTEVADQANGGAFYFADSGGSGSALKIAGANDGNSPAHTNLTEEWTQALGTVSFDID